MQLLRWNNQGYDTDVFNGKRGWMSRIKPRLRRREKNVLDMPLYRSGRYAHDPVVSDIAIFRQLGKCTIPLVGFAAMNAKAVVFLVLLRSLLLLGGFRILRTLLGRSVPVRLLRLPLPTVAHRLPSVNGI